jgi:hypothetical protein
MFRGRTVGSGLPRFRDESVAEQEASGRRPEDAEAGKRWACPEGGCERAEAAGQEQRFEGEATVGGGQGASSAANVAPGGCGAGPPGAATAAGARGGGGPGPGIDES